MQQAIFSTDIETKYSAIKSRRKTKKAHYATIGSKYQIVIPKQVRQELEIKPGDKLYVDTDQEGVIILVAAPKNWAERNFGALKKYWQGINMIEEVEKIRDEPET
ncbi:AbrB/MazE/SpoVT family DNA-binding domain-containing protein [Candidatus Daviesbacteria bacterium]|nr:AbrB/MazE/SpoVT family DNA-binding domain-containing protein [Candidatus Daviesbacteria bacterium]